MGLFDFLGGGTPAQKALRLKPKLSQKYGDPTTRQKAIAQLAELDSPDAVPVLMQRFLFRVEPQTTDAEEKQTVFEHVCAQKEHAVPHVVDFLTRNEGASSWALKVLDTVLPEERVVAVVVGELTRLGAEYTRDPEKKEVLLHHLAGRADERVGPAARPFLHDMSDDVKIAALKTLASVKYEPAREDILTLLTAEDTARRVQNAAVAALVDAEFTVKGFREKVEARLPDGHTVDRAGVVKRRVHG